MKEIFKWAFALGVAFSSSAVVAQEAEAPKRPNIVLILADDLGYTDIAPFGSEIATPNISALAARGMIFTNYHTAASCAPTRAMLLTGVDSHRNGVPNIPEALPPSQMKHENYQGTLSHNVVTVAQMLKDAGYHTYMTGKWHLGKTPDLLPISRGFERTVTLADTGADNWEQKPYLPYYDKANWYADGKEISLPEDFYSSRYLVDNMISFIDENHGDKRPFFSYVPFQAVHIPVQAPQEFIDKYMDKYQDGWAALRAQRLARAQALGIVPEDIDMVVTPGTKDWDALSVQDQRMNSKRLAVYAAMVEAMDHHIGRLVDHLKEIGEYDNTVFIFTSDNGAEASDPLTTGGASLKFWLKRQGYRTDYETLGTKGSFNFLGTSNATAAAAPLAYYKFYTAEGGMRVPLLISGDVVSNHGSMSDAFTYVTDIAPTILSLAGLPFQDGRHLDRFVEPMIGRSLIPLASGEQSRAHRADEPIGYELGGHAALFKGDYKIVFNRGISDYEWHLYNIAADPGEAHDLKEVMPELFDELKADYAFYRKFNNVLDVPEGYNQLKQFQKNTIRKKYIKPYGPYVGLFVVVIAGLLFWRRRSKAV